MNDSNLPEPHLRYVWNVIAFLERSPDDIHRGHTNREIALTLRAIQDAYVVGPAKKKGFT